MKFVRFTGELNVTDAFMLLQVWCSRYTTQYSEPFTALLIWQTNLYLWLAGLSHILAPSSVSRCTFG